MTTIFYDNDIKRLIVNFAQINKNNIKGSIIKLSNNEIKTREIKLNNPIPEFKIPIGYIDEKPSHNENHKKR